MMGVAAIGEPAATVTPAEIEDLISCAEVSSKATSFDGDPDCSLVHFSANITGFSKISLKKIFLK
jgi:hypothetical protein